MCEHTITPIPRERMRQKYRYFGFVRFRDFRIEQKNIVCYHFTRESGDFYEIKRLHLQCRTDAAVVDSTRTDPILVESLQSPLDTIRVYMTLNNVQAPKSFGYCQKVMKCINHDAEESGVGEACALEKKNPDKYSNGTAEMDCDSARFIIVIQTHTQICIKIISICPCCQWPVHQSHLSAAAAAG